MNGLPTWADARQQGVGRVEVLSDRVRLLRPTASEREYSDAQISDRPGTPGWRPPLEMTVRARFSHPLARLRGTAGFGFWNAAVAPGALGLRPPRAAWFFFGSPPHDVPLALGVPGHGLKAAVLDAQRPAFYALLPGAPLGFLLMRAPGLYRRLWPFAQWAIGASEASLDWIDATQSHAYSLRWERRGATFAVDGRTALRAPHAPAGPLRFVAWIDNAYAVATPQGRFRLGLVAEPEPQWLEIEDVEIRRSAT